MVNRKIRFALILIFSFAVLFSAEAQEKKFIQKLSWNSDKNAFEYGVEIQGVNNSYSKSITTDKNYVEVSLASGEYKYRVFAYDFLGRQQSVSQWRNFKVIKAVSPEIAKTEKSVVPEKEEKELSVPVDVKSIEVDSKVVLINKETNEEVSGTLEVSIDSKNQLNASKAVFPKVAEGEWVMKITNPNGLSSESETINVKPVKTHSQIKAEEEKNAAQKKAEEERLAAELKAEQDRMAAELKAEEERLAAELKAEEDRIAAELRAEEERIAAEKKAQEDRLAAEKKAEEERHAAELKAPGKIIDFTILAGGGVTIPVYQNAVIKELKDSEMKGMMQFIPGADIKIAWLPVKGQGWKSGAELSVTGIYGFLQNDIIRADFPMLFTQLNFVMQKQFFNEKTFVALKAGGLVYFIEEAVTDLAESKTINFADMQGVCGPGVQAGVSFVWIPAKHFQMELGADFDHLFIKDSPAGYINTYLVMGVRL